MRPLGPLDQIGRTQGEPDLGRHQGLQGAARHRQGPFPFHRRPDRCSHVHPLGLLGEALGTTHTVPCPHTLGRRKLQSLRAGLCRHRQCQPIVAVAVVPFPCRVCGGRAALAGLAPAAATAVTEPLSSAPWPFLKNNAISSTGCMVLRVSTETRHVHFYCIVTFYSSPHILTDNCKLLF